MSDTEEDFLLIFISGVLCVWQCGARGEKWRHSSVPVLPVREEALGPCWSCGSSVLPAAGGDPAVGAVLVQTVSEQVHQVKLFNSFR